MNLDKGQVGCSIFKGWPLHLASMRHLSLRNLLAVTSLLQNTTRLCCRHIREARSCAGARPSRSAPSPRPTLSMRFNWSNPKLSDAFFRLPHSCAHQFGNIWKYRTGIFWFWGGRAVQFDEPSTGGGKREKRGGGGRAARRHGVSESKRVVPGQR